MFEKTTSPKASQSPGIESMLYEETIIQWMGVIVKVIKTYDDSI